MTKEWARGNGWWAMGSWPRAMGSWPRAMGKGKWSLGSCPLPFAPGPLIRLAIMTALAVAIGGGATVFACPMCFGAEESSLIDGAKLGILVMLGITFAVQGAFVGFFFYLRKRAKEIAEADLDHEWSELQRASKTS